MIRVEFEKQLRRLRTLVVLGLLVGFPAAITLVFKVGSTGGQHGGGGFVELARESGLNMAILVLDHMGPTVLLGVGAVLAGSVVAEEASWGTLGYMLVRPVGRGRLLASKLVVIAALTLLAVALASLVAVVAGLAVFGWQSVETPSGTMLSPGTALARVAMATPYLVWSLTGIMSIAFFVSTRSNSPLYAAATAFGLAVISEILDSFSAMGDARIVLPTHYWSAWQDLFASPADWDGVLKGTALQVPYVIVILAITFWSFRKRDILT